MLCVVQARKLVQAAEPEDEVAGLPLPLLARAAAHWKVRTQQHQPPHPPSAPAAFEQKPLSPVEELLGPGMLYQLQVEHTCRSTDLQMHYQVSCPLLAPFESAYHQEDVALNGEPVRVVCTCSLAKSSDCTGYECAVICL